MKTAFIFHGSNGNPEKHWYPWLKNKLKEKGLEVFVPQFPIEENQTLKNWLDTLEPLRKHLEGSILIGHSLGVPFILNVVDRWEEKVNSAFLISGFAGRLEVEDEPNIEDFSDRDFHWEAIRRRCGKFYIIHSDNDPYVPLEKAEELAENLGGELTMVKGGKHFQAQSGYEAFDFLLEKIEEVL